MMLWVFVVLIILLVVLLAANIRIVPQAHSYVVERLGAYKETWDVGLHVKVPFIDRVARQVDLKEQYCDFPPQPVITQDNVTMQIDSIVFFRISDPMAYAYGVRNPIGAIENLTATTLRNVIGSLTLDETLTSRDQINAQMQDALDIATDPWGIKITRVELKNINPPEQIRDAMEKQMKAEREKREKILFAEGEKQSQITVAEGEKQSKILQAEADKQATILRAEAEREKKIREAEGQAEAIKSIQHANAEGIRMLKEAGADESVLTLKSLEAFEKAADGQATKIIVPSNLQGIAGLAGSIKEIVK
ncbi:SPFH domain-containing protein [Butyrivibrio sp. MC2021]|uniref:SPFH domain-containing protein n=1 Tax=Butyrivibrio sp. MC2021 TaxID=1408306 RepID=UPI000478C171|nr:SPFH domain-containing protein [Butyrivibrio sp. MC2021]